MTTEFIGKVTFDIRYVVTDEQAEEIRADARAQGISFRQAAKNQLELTFRYWAFEDNQFIGTPGQSLESVVIYDGREYKVREFKALPPEYNRYS